MLLIILSVTCAASVICAVSTYLMYQQVRTLRQQLIAAHTNTSFDCLTRTGIRATYQSSKKGLVFMDLDHMHGLNSLLGYEQVDALIKRALSTIRATDKVESIGQWMSGDEFIITCPAGTEVGLAYRLKAVMAKITTELASNPEVLAKHEELVLTDTRYGMVTPTFAATYGCIVTSSKADLSAEVARASSKVQKAKSNGNRGTVN